MKTLHTLILILCFSLFYQCKNASSDTKELINIANQLRKASPQEVDQLVAAFIQVENGGTINIEEGYYEIETQLILDNVKDVTVKGKGMDKTILSFKNLTSGGEGMKAVGENIVLEDFAVYDAPGDGVKAQHCTNLTFRRVFATWTNGDKSKNGTYAIYPVQSKNVVIDECKSE